MLSSYVLLTTLALITLAFQAASMQDEAALQTQMAAIVDTISYQAEKIAKLEKLIANRFPDYPSQISKGIPNVERISVSSNPPTSCIDLQNANHCLNGYYTIKNVQTNTLDTVFCNFNENNDRATQTWIGTMEIKTKQVQFSVKRITNYGSANTVIPFETETLNIGKAMNTSTGIFTAPVSGTYYFAFSALKTKAASPKVYILLQKNGMAVTSTYTEDVSGSSAYISFGTQISMSLKAGDFVNLYLKYGTLFDTSNVEDAYTVFSGWLQTQDLSAVL